MNKPRRVCRHPAGTGLAVLGLLAAAACEQAFEPIQTPEVLYLSMYGFLDASASADTQWVRVGGIRNGIHTSPDHLDAVVTLEHLETGRTVVLRDSAFTYQRELEGELYAVNFWTTEPIEPGGSYRLVAERTDGALATATVRVPEPFPSTITVEVSPQPQSRPWALFSSRDPRPRDAIRVEGVQNLALVEVLYHIPEECAIEFSIFRARQPLPFRSLDPDAGEDVHTASITKILRQGPGELPDSHPLRQNPVPCDRPVTKHAIHLVASGSEWLDQSESSEAAGHMDLAHNVDNAVGFMDGVITTTIPYGSCWVPDRFARCVLVYGPESASVRGTVRDCDERPLDDPFAFVTLVEIETGKERTAGLDPDGFYEMGALVPENVHEVRVTVDDPSDPNEVHFEAVVDTVTFESGEQRTLDIRLRGSSDTCP